MKPPKFSHQIKQNLIVIEWFVDTNGLEIFYEYNRKEQTIKLDWLDAASLLEKYGMIEKADGSRVLVLIEESKWETSTRWMEWDEFVETFTFSQADAMTIAVGEESEKSLNQWATCVLSAGDNMLKTKSLIKSQHEKSRTFFHSKTRQHE